MKILILEKNTLGDRPPETGAVIEGKTYTDLVASLSMLAPFLGANSPQAYMERVLQGLNASISLEGDLEEQSRRFIRYLGTRGLIGFCVMDKAKTDELPEKLWEAILLVRDSGETNMLVYTEVARLMELQGYKLEAEWVLQNRVRYFELIIGCPVELKEGGLCADK